MTSFDYTITHALGLHARPAGSLVKQLQAAPQSVTLRCGARSADAKRIFQIMTMAVKQGEVVTVEVDGPGEAALAAELQDFFAANF